MTNTPEGFREKKEVIMVQLSFTSLLLVLMLSSVVALGVPSVALANKEVRRTKNDQALGSVKELGDENKMVAATQSGRLNGRKMGVENVPKKEVGNEMNTGMDMNSPGKSYGTPNTEDSSVLEPENLTNTDSKSQVSQSPSTDHDNSLGSIDQFQAMGTQKLLEANAEMFRMMNKDYHQKARRRPPINNNVPTMDQNKNLAP